MDEIQNREILTQTKGQKDIIEQYIYNALLSSFNHTNVASVPICPHYIEL